MVDTSAVNAEYYGQLSQGRLDYWRYMAAPRFRMATFLWQLAKAPPQRLVDLGCGNGELLQELRRRHPAMKCAGIDFSASQIAYNQKSSPDIDWHIYNLDEVVAFPETLKGQFDAVLASEVIEHLEHPREFLLNMCALARPGTGRLILSTQSGPIRETEKRVGHRQHFTTEQVRQLLVVTGWTPTRVWNAGYPFHDLSKWYANVNADRSMRQFGGEGYGFMQRLVCFLLRGAFRLNSNSRGAQLFAVAQCAK